MIALRSYIRALLKEEGDLQIRVLRSPTQLGKYSAVDVTSNTTSFFKDALKGMSTLSDASSIFRRSKSGRFKAAFDSTKGSRKNAALVLTSLGVVGYLITKDYAEKHRTNEGGITAEDKDRLSKALGDFHNDVVKTLDNAASNNISSLRTPGLADIADSITVESASKIYPTYASNFTKYVGEYVRPASFETQYDSMFNQTNELQSSKSKINTLIENTIKAYPEYDRDGLRYYAACAMYVHYGEIIVAAIDADCDIINQKIAANEQITIKFNQFSKAKKAEMEGPSPTANLKKALNTLDGIE